MLLRLSLVCVLIALGSCLEVWVTTGDQTKLLQRDANIEGSDQPGTDRIIAIDKNATHQSIKGFGAAISNSAAYLLFNAQDRDAILRDLFDPATGIGIEYIRLVMGGSDFNAVPPYTYNDLNPGETDFNLEAFSIDNDLDFTVPVLKDILAINPDVKILASPWSAPAWTKFPESLNGGRLIDESQYKQVLAQYFVRFIQAYEDEGITIDAITIQNEPGHGDGGYPTMEMSWQQQSTIIREHLGPAFDFHSIDTEIIIWDHNWDDTGFANNILDDSDTKQYVGGSAWHCYAGNKNGPEDVTSRHPDKDIYFTECSGGEWDTDFGSSLGWNVQNLFIGQARIGARTVLLWNMALDENHGPRVGVTGGCSDCRGVVTIHSNGDVDKNVEYYGIGQFSKFVRQGAYRIDSTTFDDDLESVSFLNPDGSVVLVVLNTAWDVVKSFQVELDGLYYQYDDIPSRTVVTFIQRP